MNKKLELTKEQKDKVIESIKNYFLNEKDEEIGDLAAMLLLDFFIEEIGKIYYNKGINDAIYYMNEKVDDMFGLEL